MKSALPSHLVYLKDEAEKAYDRMYDAATRGQMEDAYRTAKEFMRDAISLAAELGLTTEMIALQERLYHIKKVYRDQFYS